MKFTVDVEDFWLDEEELSEALETHLVATVTHRIEKSIKEKIEERIDVKVKQAIDEKLETLIDNQLSVLINEGKITPSGKKEILFTDHIRTLFMSNTGWSRPDQQIKKLAKDFGEQMKLQYNNAFANQIVMGMKEQGLLKDEVVQILLDGPTT